MGEAVCAGMPGASVRHHPNMRARPPARPNQPRPTGAPAALPLPAVHRQRVQVAAVAAALLQPASLEVGGHGRQLDLRAGGGGAGAFGLAAGMPARLGTQLTPPRHSSNWCCRTCGDASRLMAERAVLGVLSVSSSSDSTSSPLFAGMPAGGRAGARRIGAGARQSLCTAQPRQQRRPAPHSAPSPSPGPTHRATAVPCGQTGPSHPPPRRPRCTRRRKRHRVGGEGRAALTWQRLSLHRPLRRLRRSSPSH